jgi:hypothetical protein
MADRQSAVLTASPPVQGREEYAIRTSESARLRDHHRGDPHHLGRRPLSGAEGWFRPTVSGFSGQC